MRESVAVAKEAGMEKEFSSGKSSGSSIQRLRDGHEMQLGSLGGVIGNIRRDGGTSSVDSIATQLSSMHTAQRAPALLALQQTHGNRYVQRVVSGIQAKLVVGQPNDIYEQEADRVADAVMRMPEPEVQRQPEEELVQTKLLAEQITPLVQRQVEEEEKEEEKILQAKEVLGQTLEVTSNLESRINTMRGGGQPLPASTRTFFEPRFGYDFSQVRVHTDARAAKTARALNARAFTVGRDIVFEAGKYKTETAEGKQLLAHELTHIIQQEEGFSKNHGNTKTLGVSKSPISVQRSPDCNQQGIIIGRVVRAQQPVLRATVTLTAMLGADGSCTSYSSSSLSSACPSTSTSRGVHATCTGQRISRSTNQNGAFQIPFFYDGFLNPFYGRCVLEVNGTTAIAEIQPSVAIGALMQQLAIPGPTPSPGVYRAGCAVVINL